MTNPLLVLEGIPDFSTIDPTCIEPAIDVLLARGHKALALAAGSAVSAMHETISAELPHHIEYLGLAWRIVAHLHAAVDSPELRAQFHACLPKLTEFCIALGSDVRLYGKCRAVASDPTLSLEAARAAWTAMQTARASGAERDVFGRRRLRIITARYASLFQRFATNLLDTTERYAYYADMTELEGVPAYVLAEARKAAQA